MMLVSMLLLAAQAAVSPPGYDGPAVPGHPAPQRRSRRSPRRCREGR